MWITMVWTETDCMVESIECVFVVVCWHKTHHTLIFNSLNCQFLVNSTHLNRMQWIIFVLVAHLFTPNFSLSTPNYHRKLMTLSLILFVSSFYCDCLIFFLCSAVIRCISLEFQRISSIVVFQRIEINILFRSNLFEMKYKFSLQRMHGRMNRN